MLKNYEKIIVIIISLIFSVFYTYAYSTEILVSKNNDNARIFDIKFSFSSNNSVRKNFNILTDFKNIHRINPSLVSAEIKSRDSNRLVLKSKFRDCILFFCREMIMYESIISYCTDRNLCVINSEVIPSDESPIKSGETSWVIRSSQSIGNSKIIYHSNFSATMSLPPFLGESIFKKTINRNLNFLKDTIGSY